MISLLLTSVLTFLLFRLGLFSISFFCFSCLSLAASSPSLCRPLYGPRLTPLSEHSVNLLCCLPMGCLCRMLYLVSLILHVGQFTEAASRFLVTNTLQRCGKFLQRLHSSDLAGAHKIFEWPPVQHNTILVHNVHGVPGICHLGIWVAGNVTWTCEALNENH